MTQSDGSVEKNQGRAAGDKRWIFSDSFFYFFNRKITDIWGSDI
jgi:hypothetical protein